MRDLARNGLAIVAWLFVGCLIVQFFLAGLGVFDDPSAFVTHREFAYLFGWLTFVLVALAALARAGRRMIGLAALTVLLMILQSVFVAVRADYPAIAALHPVNGVALLLVAIVLARSAWAARSGVPAGA